MKQGYGSFVLASFVLAATTSLVRAEDLADMLTTVTDTLLPNQTHQAHFEVANSAENVSLIDGINQAIATQFSTIPLGGSAGGFTSTLDPTTGVGTRNSNTFGPQFAERALTIGRHKWDVGLQYLHASYDNLNGTDITDGSLTIQLLHEDDPPPGRLDPGSFFEGDVMTNQLSYNLTLDTTLIIGTFGVTDRFDLGLVLPYVNADLSIDAAKTTQPLATRTASPHTHEFDVDNNGDPIYTGSSSISGSANGIGDIVLRGKYNFLDPAKGSGVALALDVRLPTGDEANFLGTGVTQAKLYAIGSWAIGKFSPHFNAGYTASFGSSDVVSDFPDEIDYTVGFEAECHPRVTFVADILGRYVLDAYVPEESTSVFEAFDPDLNGGAGGVYSTTLTQMKVVQEDQNLLQGALGLKINPGSRWLISVAALLPISDNGLTSNLAGVLGFSYSF